MDSITLATVTAAVTTLAMECVKKVASKAGEDLWGKIKSLFGWTSKADEPGVSQLPVEVARRLQEDEALAQEVIDLLQEHHTESAGQLVGSIKVDKGGKLVVGGVIGHVKM